MWKRQKTRDETNYDALIKTALTGHLGEAVREVQRQQQHQASVVEGTSESAQTLCSVVEALFVHRLRDSFVDKVSNVFSGDVVRQPSPNFWPFLLGFSHRHSVDYLSDSCPWLRTDIGRCRGWIRLVINDGMLTSYLELLAGERRLLGDFYDRQAYLRDPEHLDIARKLLSGIEVLQFRLAVNSSMLNTWSTTPLLLAGLWSPPTPVIHEAVVQGVDAALCFTDEDETLQPIKKVVKKSAVSNMPKLDEDLAFRLIVESDKNIPNGMLAAIESPSISVPPPEPESAGTVISRSPTAAALVSPSEEVDSQAVLVTRLRIKNSRCSSPAVEETKTASTVSSLPATPPQHVVTEGHPLVDEEAMANVMAETPIQPDAEEEDSEGASTFEDLLENYSNLNIGCMGTRSPESTPSEPQSSTRESSPEEKFEVIDDATKETESPFASLLRTLNHESSLVKQNYRCVGCSSPVGLIYGPARVCSFTGGLYCPECHVDDEVIIPARVFLNGDFSKRKVCRAVRQYFRDIESDAVLNAVEFDCNIYAFQQEFAALLNVRTQLQHLSAFLLTCRTSGASNEFCKRTYGKSHLYEQEHTYCLADLPLIPNGQLHNQLTKLIQFSKHHVVSCSFCIMKGFLCEACRSDAVIFPFDLESTFRCSSCGAVFHSKCMNRSKPCPRCERWKNKKRLEELEQHSQDPDDQDQED